MYYLHFAIVSIARRHAVLLWVVCDLLNEGDSPGAFFTDHTQTDH